MMMNVGAAGRRGRLATWSHRRALTGLAAAGAALALAGCGGSSPAQPTLTRSASPTVSTPATSPPSSATAASPRAAVIAAYAGYSRALVAADDSQSRARARVILTPYLPSAQQVDKTVNAFAKLWKMHQISFGVPVVRVLHVKIHGPTAILHTCENTAQDGLKDTRTGQVIAGSQGKRDNNLITRLTYHHGWRVNVQTELGLPCSAKL